MKVVLFCGGLGLRLRDFAESIPKPLATIGYRPILWHVMKYYAHYGHKEFILCLGHRGDAIKNYFVHYDEYVSNDFTLSGDGKNLNLINRDIHDWKITFVDTGLSSNIGQRLRAVEKYLEGEEIFMANYTDGLTDLPLAEHIEHFQRHGKTASFLCIRPNMSYHLVTLNGGDLVTSIEDMARSNIRINGGYFIFRRSIFKYMREGEELVQEPFRRLVAEQQLMAYRYDGFWACMDTFKDKQQFDELYAKGNAPWEVWKSPSGL
jgi:glucose-1-phosphate cytidylyltransferase